MSESEVAEWDPHVNQREWYRDVTTGDLGWRVRRGGVDKIRLDRPNEELIRPFRPGEWVPVQEHRPYTVAQVAKIAFMADQVLMSYQGGKKKEWVSLSDDERIWWMEKGPKKNEMRARLYMAVFEAMKPFYR